MTDHDPLCTMAHLPYDGRCWCPLITKARADERERITKALDSMDWEARGMVLHPSTGRLWLVRADALRDAARIARGGGRDGD